MQTEKKTQKVESIEGLEKGLSGNHILTKESSGKTGEKKGEYGRSQRVVVGRKKKKKQKRLKEQLS